eukprot:CAMPEP_0204229114 /NCGR_PEP_ID=MMETSP0361-20130328/86964_1 /ASSEMBLY_ACC=CAM_ASM_000343 /TAXON_ID=268821 /ORGANISM="Scrippsiella Hangoei, Strain SHTV-5" /LENGTH=31 /DNA_ID= /DNA_START= /DNA_END= /DNA_ORIENTATION=
MAAVSHYCEGRSNRHMQKRPGKFGTCQTGYS